MPMFQLRTEVGSLAAAESILHSQMHSGMSKSAFEPTLKTRSRVNDVGGAYREANNSEGRSPSRLTPVRQSNSMSLSDPESVLAEARMTLQWPYHLDPCSRRNFRWRKASGTRVLSAVRLCFHSANENIIFN